MVYLRCLLRFLGVFVSIIDRVAIVFMLLFVEFIFGLRDDLRYCFSVMLRNNMGYWFFFDLFFFM